MQAAGDGDGAAQGDVQFGKFFGGEFGGGVDGGARFADDDFVQSCFRQRLDEFAREFVGFAAGGAVADGDEFDAVLFDEAGEGSERVVFLVQVNDGGVEQFAGVIDDGAFDAVAVAGV